MIVLLAVSLALQAQAQAQAQGFVPMRHPGTDSSVNAQLRTLCPAPDLANHTALLNREVDAGNRAPFRGAPEDAWTKLGCARVALSMTDVTPREGPAMPLGGSWSQGALSAMLEAVERHPAQGRAAEVAALLALRELRPRLLERAANDFVKAIHAGVTTPAVLRGCDEFALRLGRDSLAGSCAALGLEHGSDSTWHFIVKARLAFRKTDSALGVHDFVQAASTARTPQARQTIQWHLQWFLAPAEVSAFARVPDGDLGQWVQNRLVARDIRDAQPMGARLAEHFKRLDYVYAHFWTYVPAVNEHRVLGRRTGVATIGIAHTGDAMTPGMHPTGSGGIVPRWQTEFDDRGVVWLRLGPPAHRYYWGYDFARELWIYEIDGERNFLQFQDEDFNGNKEATRLVTGVIDPFFCGLDKLRCEVSAYVYSPAPPELVAQIRAQDAQSTRLGSVLDDNSRRDAAHIDVVAQEARLWNPTDGSPFTLISYAVRLQDLRLTGDSTALEGAFTLRLRQMHEPSGVVSDTTVVRYIRVAGPTAARSHLTGLFVLPGGEDVSTWSLAVDQDTDRSGRAYEMRNTPAVAIDTGTVALSDLVLGAQSQGLRWNGFREPVTLGPLGAFSHTETVELFYQTKSSIDLAHVSTSLTLTCVECGLRFGETPPRLSVAFDRRLEHGIAAVYRGLDVSTLVRGSYQLDVVLRDTEGRILTVKSRRLYLD